MDHCWGQKHHLWVNTALQHVETSSPLVNMSFLWIQSLVEMSLPWLELLLPPSPALFIQVSLKANPLCPYSTGPSAAAAAIRQHSDGLREQGGRLEDE